MQKLVLLSPAHPLRGGIASSTERLALELQQQGYQVTIYSFSYQYPSLLFPGKTQYADGPAPEGLNIRSAIHSINPFNWWKVGQALRKAQPDLIIARYWLPFMGPSMGTILRLARRNGHTRTLAITDNVIPHERRPGDRLLTRYFIGAVQAFIVMSRAVGKDIRRFTSTKPVKYIPHPIYDNYGPLAERKQSLQQLSLPQNQRYILFFGFVRAYKGLDLLLHAMAHAKVRRLGVKLIVAGEFYEEESRYRKIVAANGLEGQVIFRSSYIPKEEVRYYFAAADMVAQPYKTATQSGISQLAFHFQKPMLVTRVGGLPEIVAHGKEGYVVDVEAGAIADAIIDFYENSRRVAMEQAVKAGRARYSWDNLVQGIRELYDKIETPS
ncbi:MAG: glycosyltransferase [Bacteroidetes bacterium]|nr:glycosyltransferase [Bacteroidota bacterium]